MIKSILIAVLATVAAGETYVLAQQGEMSAQRTRVEQTELACLNGDKLARASDPWTECVPVIWRRADETLANGKPVR